MNDLEPLSNDLTRLLDVERDIDDVASPARARMLSRLEAALPLLPPASPRPSKPNEPSPKPSPDGTGSGSPLGSSAIGAVKGKLWGPAIALLLGAAAGAGGHALTRPTAANVSPVASSVVIKVVVLPHPTDVSPPSAKSADGAGVLIDLSNDATTSSPSASASANEHSAHGAQHNAELLLLDAARTALTRGDYESALSALRRDARENPHGQLAEEREVMMVQALSASGDAAAAKQRAADFKQQFPDSLNRDTVDQLTPKKP